MRVLFMALNLVIPKVVPNSFQIQTLPFDGRNNLVNPMIECVVGNAPVFDHLALDSDKDMYITNVELTT